MKTRYLFYMLLFLMVNTLFAQQNELPLLQSRFIDAKEMKSNYLGFQVIDLESGKQVAGFNENKLFTPASTLKVMYTLAAVHKFGEEFRFETSIESNGELMPDGSLEGDLIIRASGDPSLASSRFDQKKNLDHFLNGIRKLLLSKGIKCIDGRLILILPYSYNPVCGDWVWEDIGNYYGSGAWGFNFNENAYTLSFKTWEKASQSTLVNIQPKLPFISHNNEVMAGEKGSGDNAYVFGGPYDFHRSIRGTLPPETKNYEIKGSIPYPPLSFLYMLKDYLEGHNILSGQVEIKKDYKKKTKLLGVHKSETLINIARECNNHSINLYSEALGALLLNDVSGSINNKDYPSEKDWVKVFSDYGLKKDESSIRDACGLAANNFISPAALNKFLMKMYYELGADLLVDILPENGEEGHARSFIKGKQYKNRLWIKSGSIAGALNYTGVYRSIKDDRYYAFSIFTNHNNVSTAAVKERIKAFLRDCLKHTG